MIHNGIFTFIDLKKITSIFKQIIVKQNCFADFELQFSKFEVNLLVFTCYCSGVKALRQGSVPSPGAKSIRKEMISFSVHRGHAQRRVHAVAGAFFNKFLLDEVLN